MNELPYTVKNIVIRAERILLHFIEIHLSLVVPIPAPKVLDIDAELLL